MPRPVQMQADTARSLFSLIAKRLDSIPTLPLAQARVLEATAREDCATLDLARLVQADPALTAKVLRVMNSPFYGRRMNVSTLAHAGAVLGLPALRNLALGIAVFPDRPDGTENLDHERFWQHSLAVAAAARVLATAVGYDLREEAYIAGLLHDMGKLVMELYAPSEYRAHLDSSGEGMLTEVESEREVLGTDHCQVGSLVAESWNLPRFIKDAIQLHHESEERLEGLSERQVQLVGIVSAADRLCWEAGLGCYRDGEGEPAAGGEVPGFGILTNEHREAVDQGITDAFREAAGVLRIPFQTGDEFLHGLARANRKAKAEVLEYGEETPLSERLAVLAEVLRTVRRLETMDQMVEEGLALARRSLGFDRLLYLQVEPQTDRLRGRHHFDDTHIEVDVHELDIDCPPEGILSTVLTTRRAQRVDSWATDGELLRFLGVLEVAAAPLVVSEENLGLICADSFFRNREITEDDVRLLDQMTMQLGLAIEAKVLAQQAETLRALAAKDELTGINNRRKVMKALQAEIDRSNRYRIPLSTVMVDIDHFKGFNDNYGHQTGDKILAEVAQLIVSESREVDIVGRYGGEEFLSVLPETALDQAIVYAERLQGAVESLGREKRRKYPACVLSISTGVTSLRHGDDDIESIIRRVDKALYAAKDRGRNRVCVD